jgi:hypothetical protein
MFPSNWWVDSDSLPIRWFGGSEMQGRVRCSCCSHHSREDRHATLRSSCALLGREIRTVFRGLGWLQREIYQSLRLIVDGQLEENAGRSPVWNGNGILNEIAKPGLVSIDTRQWSRGNVQTGCKWPSNSQFSCGFPTDRRGILGGRNDWSVDA